MQTGNFQLVREINRRLIFGLIRQGDRVSRASLVEATELSKATVSAVVDELIERRLVIEAETTSIAVGRRPILLKVNGDGALLGAVQIRPDRVIGCLCDPNGRVRDRLEEACRSAEGQSLIKTTIAVQAGITRLAGRARQSILGMGVGVPGILNTPGDVVLCAPALGWRDVSLRRVLEAVAGFPVWLGDEIKLAALAEATAGAGRGAEVLLYLGVGDTVGAAVVQRGQLAPATYAGHLTAAPDGPRCWCGNRGCLEVLVGNDGLRRRAEELLAAGRRFDTPPVEISGSWLCRQAEQGDDLAREILAGINRWLGTSLAGLVNLYQPELVLLGGWVAESAGCLAAIEEEARRRALPAVVGPVRVLPAGLGEDAVLVGAAALALEGALGALVPAILS